MIVYREGDNKYKCTPVAKAAYSVRNNLIYSIPFMMYLIVYIILLCKYGFSWMLAHDYLNFILVINDLIIFGLIFCDKPTFFKVDGKNRLHFTYVRYKKAAYDHVPFLNLIWVRVIDFEEVESVELCEFSKKEVKKIIYGPSGTRKYLKITLKNGKQNGISIANYSLKQIEKIMEEIEKCLAKR